MSSAWRQYQQEVAEVLRAMGFKVTVEEIVTGARASHAVDVTVRLRICGVAVLWIVECKLWKVSVRKEQVMTLMQIAQDVGADRAFLLSESGFQAGTLTAVRNTNVTLADLPGLLAVAEEDTLRERLVDGTYLILATPDADRTAWRLHADLARQGATNLRSALGDVQGPRLPD